MMNIAIVGATGNVGRKILEVLEKKNFSLDNLYLVASSKSAGSKITFKDKELEVFDLEKFDFSKAKITFFAAGGKIKKNIIANPNCSTAQLVIALKPLHDAFKIKRVVTSTYQSVSGGGKAPMDELIEQTKLFLDNREIKSKNFTKQIAFNAIPHIDVFADDGYTKEELKMTNETKKILDSKIELTATCVRLPVLVSHSESVNIEFEKPFAIDKVRQLLDNADGCKVVDERKDGGYSTPIEAAGKNDTFISRIREDKTINNGLNLWIVSDNLLRGAALNAVEIAETLIKNNFYGK